MSSSSGSCAPVLPAESFLLWIHCNRCFQLYAHKRSRLFMFTCKHIVCENCAALETAALSSSTMSAKCPLCKKDVRGRQIGNVMPSHIKELFHPHPWKDGLPAANIMYFQTPHRKHFQLALKNLDRQFGLMDQKFDTERKHLKTKYGDVEKLRVERKHLERRTYEIIERRKKEEKERERQLQRQTQLRQKYVSLAASTNESLSSAPVLRPRYPASHPVRMAQSQPFFAASRQVMPSPNCSSDVTGFVTRYNNSFDL